jgi:YD repeat-containing protein
MRLIRLVKLISLTLPLVFSQLSLAQGWIKYVNEAERFIVNFPREPDIREIDYISEQGATFPARVYSVNDSESRYTVTVVDYTVAEKVHEERCTHLGYVCDGFEAGSDVRGSIAFAAWNIRQQNNGEITYDAYATVDGIPGHQLQITHADGSRSFIGIHLHARRLYILEGAVPEDWPPPGLFQQSLGILDEDGKRIRYRYDANDNRIRMQTSYEWGG